MSLFSALPNLTQSDGRRSYSILKAAEYSRWLLKPAASDQQRHRDLCFLQPASSAVPECLLGGLPRRSERGDGYFLTHHEMWLRQYPPEFFSFVVLWVAGDLFQYLKM